MARTACRCSFLTNGHIKDLINLWLLLLFSSFDRTAWSCSSQVRYVSKSTEVGLKLGLFNLSFWRNPYSWRSASRRAASSARSSLTSFAALRTPRAYWWVIWVTSRAKHMRPAIPVANVKGSLMTENLAHLGMNSYCFEKEVGESKIRVLF